MQIIIRTDASHKIGSGHVMRCLTLAEALRNAGSTVVFITRPHAGNLDEHIQNKGFHVHSLTLLTTDQNTEQLNGYEKWLGCKQQKDAEESLQLLTEINYDWLIIDHYALDSIWEKLLSPLFKKVMVIDDLGNRDHYCHLLLDQNFGSSKEKYMHQVPKFCRTLFSPTYALLRPEFNQWRDFSLKRRSPFQFKQLIITLGGMDADNYTSKILQQLKTCILPEDLTILIVMGATAPHLKMIQTMVKDYPYKSKVKVNVANMAELMANSDLAIGAAGATSWERCCLGLPTIQLVIAENQKAIAQSLTQQKAIVPLDSVDSLANTLESVSQWMEPVSQTARLLCDGLGTTRVIQHLLTEAET